MQKLASFMQRHNLLAIAHNKGVNKKTARVEQGNKKHKEKRKESKSDRT